MKKRRRSRVRSSVDARLNRPVALRMTSLAIGPIMNAELREMQAVRKANQTQQESNAC